MKKIILIATVLISTSVVFGQAQKTNTVKKKAPSKAIAKEAPKPAEPAKPISFDQTLIERSNIAKGTNDRFTFTFKNTGKTPILIQDVITSCGCTTASKPDQPIAPGEKSEISVKYDTFRIGAFEKTITVKTNVQPEPIVLTIKGNVLEE
ncbi:MAG: DUF1573 domain-containing protein [Bacteroidetes bacterium]|nr:DUF1573 domain-containing protein [Bacteroidota bacterium]